MFRSMLYVRYGSGCSLWQTACAARPRSSRLASRNRVTPSSKLSRPPSTARRKIVGTVEDKVYSFRGQSEASGHLGETSQPRQLWLSQLVRQNASQVIVTGCEVQS